MHRSYGATLLSVRTPDRDGVLAEVTLNRDTVAGLLHKNAYYGSTVGRVRNAYMCMHVCMHV